MEQKSKLSWRITRFCNLHCSHCLAGYGNSFRADLTPPQQIACLENMARAGVSRITWTGGEPTLCKSFPALMELCHLYKIRTILTTHGLSLRPEIIDALQPEGDVVRLSFDGLETVHNSIRGGAFFQKTITTIPRLLGAGLRVEANVTLMAKTLNDLPRLIELLVEKGITKIVVLTLLARESALVNGLLGCSNAEISRVINNISDIRCRNSHVVIQVNNYSNPLDRYLVVESDGEILLCSESLGDASFGYLHAQEGEQALRLALSAQTLSHRTFAANG